MKKYLYLFISVFFGLLFFSNVSAIQTGSPFNSLRIAETGDFINNSTNYSSLGYTISQYLGNYTFFKASPTVNSTISYGSSGVSLVQCGMSFVKDNYYSVSYYFLSDSFSYYYHPSYSNSYYKLGISTSTSLKSPTFTYEAVSNDIQFKLIDGLGYVQSYTVIFKAPNAGTCFLSTFNSNPSGSSLNISFVGYEYEHLGSSSLSSSDIQNALSSSFNEVSSKIDSYNKAINDNINELKAQQAEANETSKGIWATLRDGLGNIGKWFTDLSSSIGEFFSNLGSTIVDGFSNLGESIGNFFSELTSSIGNFFSNLGESIGGFFSNLWDGIYSLFFGEEVTICTTYHNYFNGFNKYYNNFTSTILDSNISLNSDGSFLLRHNTGYNSYFMPPVDDIKPNTTYRIFLEVLTRTQVGGTQTDLDYTEFHFGTGYGVPNVTYQVTQLGGAVGTNWAIRFSDIGVYSYDFTTPSIIKEEADFLMGIYVTHYSATYRGDYRIVVTDDLSMTVDNYEYFSGTRENCEVTGSSGGLFGILGNMISSIGDWFANLFGFMEDDDVDTSASGGFFDDFDNDDYGLSDIITMPLQTIKGITAASCSPLSLPLPFVENDLVLPCMYEVYSQFGAIMTLYQTITFGMIAYWVCIKIYGMVRNFKNPDSDEIEVLDL